MHYIRADALETGMWLVLCHEAKLDLKLPTT